MMMGEVSMQINFSLDAPGTGKLWWAGRHHMAGQPDGTNSGNAIASPATMAWGILREGRSP
jgi:hypothetical protein